MTDDGLMARHYAPWWVGRPHGVQLAGIGVVGMLAWRACLLASAIVCALAPRVVVHAACGSLPTMRMAPRLWCPAPGGLPVASGPAGAGHE